MDWFTKTFLPSLYEYAGNKQARTISDKQAEICCRYMQEEKRKIFNGLYKIYYVIKWNGRKIEVTNSRSGKWIIHFYQTAEEAEAERIAQEERERKMKSEKRNLNGNIFFGSKRTEPKE